ncbi:MAG: gliding motility-associated C-terminal domain-containing protein [Bacteroidetes bacterium]|nr:gliding motility-associated C-terminal domain-containing protein [Bacteroidota bacterium]
MKVINYITLSALMFSVFELDAQCNAVNPAPQTICSLDTATIDAGVNFRSYSWSEGQTTQVIKVTPTNTTSYSCTVTCYGPDVVTNGGFESGNTGFSSAYTNNQGSLQNSGRYAITSDCSIQKGDWIGLPHTGSLFMAVNGSGTPNTDVWCQTINVLPNTTYEFSTWVKSLSGTPYAQLQFSINGVTLGNIFSATAESNGWINFFETWNSGVNTTANICIVNMNTAGAGNDFGLDDIFFRPIISQTITTTVTVHHTPIADFNYSGSLCVGVTKSFTDNSNPNSTVIASYDWDFNNDGISDNSTTSAGYTFNTIGNAIISLSVTSVLGCTSVKTSTLVVNDNPTATITSTSITCFGGNNGTLSASGSGGGGNYTYKWMPGNINAANANNLTAQTFTCTVTDANGCSAQIPATVSEPAQLVPTFAYSNLDCFQGTNGFIIAGALGGVKNSNNDYDYLLNPGGYTTSYVDQLPAGTYQSIVTDGNGCTATQQITITEPPLLTVAINAPLEICDGQSATIVANPVGGTPVYTFDWLSHSLTGQTIIETPTTSQVYDLLVTDQNGCTAELSHSITVNPLPTVDFSADNLIGCGPVCANFTPTTSNVISYAWNFGDGGSSSATAPNYCFASSGTFTVNLIVTDAKGCTNTASKADYITVHPDPVAQFATTPSSIDIIDPTIQLVDMSSGAVGWLYTFGDGTGNFSTDANTTYTFPADDTATYDVKQVVINQFGCMDSIIKKVTVALGYTFYFPNTFSPNGDGLNDVFNFRGLGVTEFNMWIYDRWGNLIYNTTDITKGWDGDVKGGGNKKAEIDVYICRMLVKDIYQVSHNYTTHITLIR